MTVTEVDIVDRPDVVHQYGLRTTPAIAINGRLEFIGAPSEGAFLARLQERGLAPTTMLTPEAAPRGLLHRVRRFFRDHMAR